MRRRDFLAFSGLGIANTLLGCASTSPNVRNRRSDIQAVLVSQNDARIPALLERQQRDASHRWCGGVVDRYDIYHAGSTSGFIRDLAVAYASPASRYAGSAELVERMAAAARFMLAAQHDDGTIDLLTTNFHSPPDTGFILEWICAATGVLRRLNRPELRALLADLDTFIVAGAGALAVGGIHTPNHRWVVCMALARANALHPNARYVNRIDRWLAEKIDIDADGQFTERSSSIYSPLTDRCLITMARLLDRPELLDPVRRNLAMTLHYVHADGEVATEGSKRQDQYRNGSLSPYYYSYRYMAQKDGDGRFAAMARWIEATALLRLTGSLIFFVEQPALSDELPPSAPLPTDYEKLFAPSQLVRIRRGKRSATILADNATFFSLHSGSAAVVVRCAPAFFGKGQFVGAALKKDRGAWVMRQDLVGPYYQPLPRDRLPGDGDWSKMPRELRPRSEVQRQRAEVRITEVDGAFVLDISISGTDGVPVAIELGFRPGGELEGVTAVDGAYVLEQGTGRFRFGEDAIEFGPESGGGRADHRWTQLRGALPKLDADCVYLTGFTPFRAELRLA